MSRGKADKGMIYDDKVVDLRIALKWRLTKLTQAAFFPLDRDTWVSCLEGGRTLSQWVEIREGGPRSCPEARY